MAALVSAGVVESGGDGPLHPSDLALGDLRRPVARRTRAAAPRRGEDPARARSVRRRRSRRTSCTPSRPPTPRRWRCCETPPATRWRWATQPAQPPCSPVPSTSLPLTTSAPRCCSSSARRTPAPAHRRRSPRCRRSSSSGEDATAIAAAAIELSGMLFFAGRAAEGAAILRRAQERLPAADAGTRAARGRAARPQLHLGVGAARGRGDDRRPARPRRPGSRRAAGHHARHAGDGRGAVPALGGHRDRPRRARDRGGPPARAPPRRELGELGPGRPRGRGRSRRGPTRHGRDPRAGARARRGADSRDYVVTPSAHRGAPRRRGRRPGGRAGGDRARPGPARRQVPRLGGVGGGARGPRSR